MKKLHHPPHLFLDNTYYFITARTYQKQLIFNNDEKKALLLNSLKAEFRNGECDLVAWVVLANHYHILFRIIQAKGISSRINMIHGKVSYLVNKKESETGRKVFQNYWDRCIRDEADFWRHFNYIHYNPIKHGYVKNMKDYKFSSYEFWLEKKGTEWLDSCFRLYPIVDFTDQRVGLETLGVYTA